MASQIKSVGHYSLNQPRRKKKGLFQTEGKVPRDINGTIQRDIDKYNKL
jgi:hypothetical protein